MFDNKSNVFFHEVFDCATLIMSSLVILLIAFIAVTGSSNKVQSSPAQALDLNKVLELVKQQRLNTGRKQHKLRLRIDSSDSDSDSDSDDSSTDLDDSDESDNNRFARLKKDRIVDLIEKVANEKTNNHRLSYRKGKKNYGETSDKSDDSVNKRLAKERIIDFIERVATENNKNNRITNQKRKQNHGLTNYLIHSENYDNTQSSNNKVQKQILEKLFSQPSNDVEQQPKQKKRLIPSRLTPTVTMDDVNKYYGNKNKNDEITGLEEYSKVYIVLNPQAVQNSKNKISLNDLISKVISLSSPTSEREPQDKRLPRHYKGFVVNENVPKRRFKGINDKTAGMSDDEKSFDPLAAPLGRITAMPT